MDEKNVNRDNEVRDEKHLEAVTGGTDIPGNQMIGFDPLNAKVDAEAMKADTTWDFVNVIGLSTGEPTHVEVFKCPICKRSVYNVTVDLKSSVSEICPWCHGDIADEVRKQKWL